MKPNLPLLLALLLALPVTHAAAQNAEPNGAQADDLDGESAPVFVDIREDGAVFNDMSLNEALQFLALQADKQYFHNAAIEGPAFRVTGHINPGDPELRMEELAFQFGLDLYRKGDTIYAFSPTQVDMMPRQELVYQLRYLRPTDIEQIQRIIQPLLTPGSGIANFEPKTNTLLVLDSARRLESVENILHQIDQPKGQIIVEVKILRVNSSVGSKIGVDWTSVLGEGLPIEATQSLNALFNLPESNIANRVITTTSDRGQANVFSINEFGERVPGNASISTGNLSISGQSPVFGSSSSRSLVETATRQMVQGSGLVLSPLEMQAVLRALNTGNLASQKSNPTLITEDNESATISIIDRVPIITTTITQSTVGQNVTEQVRYRIDESDPVNDFENTREIGVTVSVTPTMLPDDTIRMQLRPRTAQIVGFVQGVGTDGVTGNQYPRVAEATIDTLARVPNGFSLLIGGFYNEEERDISTKVPILGDIPLLNFFFRSSEKRNEQTSLVFIITPTSYDPRGATETLNVTDQLMDRLDLKQGFDSINPDVPGPAHEADLHRTMRAILNDQFGPLSEAEREAPARPAPRVRRIESGQADPGEAGRPPRSNPLFR